MRVARTNVLSTCVRCAEYVQHVVHLRSYCHGAVSRLPKGATSKIFFFFIALRPSELSKSLLQPVHLFSCVGGVSLNMKRSASSRAQQIDASASSRTREIEAERAALKAERARLRELVKQEKRKRKRLLARAAKLSRADLLGLAANAQ